MFELAKYRNSLSETPVIPERVITRPPSAELRPDQKDQDSLPAYDVLDAILYAYIEEDLGQADIIAKGFDKEVVEKVIRLVDRNEYKRRQGDWPENYFVHLVANDVIRLSTVGQRMTEQKNSSKLQHLLKHFA